ncbi:MAG: crossover junction endodeoxyribonuclease RuvC [Armatimonadetes bacterium]|nr:crossover junction endodeoxyribonuclease RuvC [Armatimonadota bacterium]
MRQGRGAAGMRVLGIDPGLGTTGYGVVELTESGLRLCEAGTVRTRPRDPLPERLRALYEGISEVIRECRPAVIALEGLYSEYRFPRTAILMAHARGAVCLAAAHLDVPVASYPPAQVKNAVVGVGNASKAQVQGTVQRMFALADPPSPNDVADALALAVTGCYRQGNPLVVNAR